MPRISPLPRPVHAIAWCLVLSLLTGCSQLERRGSKDLPGLVVERLGWMNEVAHIKQRHHLPVTDAKREAALLRAMTAQGVEAGLPAAATRQFFAAQIDAAKIYQQQWMKRMSRSKARLSQPSDLTQVVRPALDDIGRRMIGALVTARQQPDRRLMVEQTRNRLQQAGHTSEVVAAAVAGVAAGLGDSE